MLVVRMSQKYKSAFPLSSTDPCLQPGAERLVEVLGLAWAFLGLALHLIRQERDELGWGQGASAVSGANTLSKQSHLGGTESRQDAVDHGGGGLGKGNGSVNLLLVTIWR